MQDADLLESQTVTPLKGEGFAWVKVRTRFDYSDRAQFGQARTARREPGRGTGRMEALEAEMEALQPEYEAYGQDADETGEFYRAIEEKAERIQWELDALSESLAEPYPDDLEIGGPLSPSTTKANCASSGA